MQLPDNIVGLINESERRRLAEGTDNTLLEVMMLNGDSLEIDKNLNSWTVLSADSTQMTISLDFEKSINVSSGFSPDTLFLQVFLS